ncbi:unnamed protein product [Linum trigynum]|uniref:Uncharacterized protein n=1 Tax=Linum trigynum TaxID=586398 RepID=A0AAV2DI87_9ROSI
MESLEQSNRSWPSSFTFQFPPTRDRVGFSPEQLRRGLRRRTYIFTLRLEKIRTPITPTPLEKIRTPIYTGGQYGESQFD